MCGFESYRGRDMPIVPYVVCDDCGETAVPSETIDRMDIQFDYRKIVSEDIEQSIIRDGWIITAQMDDDDPVAMDLEYVCPSCNEGV